MSNWNLWHGCQKISPGCQNCYVYSGDKRYDRSDSFIVRKTGDFDLPLKKDRYGRYKLQPDGEPVYTCMTSDFFVEDADCWRQEAWEMMRLRQDLHFVIFTKRIHRAEKCLPPDWGDGYDNVTLCSTCENQRLADFRLPIFMELPAKHRQIICAPLLEEIHLEKYLQSGKFRLVSAGGESGANARLCRYDWVLSLRGQCEAYNVGFWFHQTGALFEKDGKTYHIPRKLQHQQARKAGIDLHAEMTRI